MSRLGQIIKTKEFKIISFIIILFIFIRLPGINLPFHQDEMKTALISSAGAEASSNFYHPPLTQIIYRLENILLGPDNFRIYILIFALLGTILTFFAVRHRLGWESAACTIFLLSIGAYSMHASLMLDTDGAILPFFFLIAVYLYDFAYKESGKRKWLFFGLLFLSLIIGFLVKLSFVIVIGAIICDFLYRERNRLNKKIIFTSVLGSLAFILVFVLVIIITKLIYPTFSIDGMISHATSYINFGQRGWTQIIIQATKAIFYLSPVLIFIPFLITKDVFEKTRLFFIYLILGFVFYFILFDFSQGALDKYLMFSIIPLSIIGGSTIHSIFKENKDTKRSKGIITGLLCSVFIIVLAFLPHDVLSLYPKSVFTSSIFNLKWNILVPFTGGSGPLGFYMSFLFIASSFILSAIMGIIALSKKEWRYSATIALILISVTYNTIFVEEYLFGKMYGSASSVLNQSIKFIENSGDIKQIITYNDTSTYELKKIGKYSGRFYAVPGNEEGHKKKFNEYNGHYLVVDVPKISGDSFYGHFFAKCTSLFEAKSKNIVSNVYSCPLTKI